MKPTKLYSLNPRAAWLWPLLIELWIGVVLVLFLIIRVLGSNMARHALRALLSY